MSENSVESSEDRDYFKFGKRFRLSTNMQLLIALLSALIILVILIRSADSTRILIMPIPPKYEPGKGLEYSLEMAKTAQVLSLTLLIIGWIFVIGGAFLAMVAALVGPKRDRNNNDGLISTILAERGLLCSAFAIIFAGVGWQCLDRSSAASLTAVIATNAISTASKSKDKDGKGHEEKKNYDRIAYDACIDAKTSWLQGRMNHDRLLIIMGDLKNSKSSESSKTSESSESSK